MTTPTNPPPREVLKPCPFCGVNLKVFSEAQGYWHPRGNCPLADFEMAADGYSEKRWNTRQASTHIDPAFVLPCDVKLPPATTIKAGCDLKTLMTALSLEGRPIEFPERRPAEASAQPGEREAIIDLIRDRREVRRFFGRRSIDKSCGEVVHVLEPDGPIGDDSFKVIERIDHPNFLGEQVASERAAELADEYTANAILALRAPRADIVEGEGND